MSERAARGILLALAALAPVVLALRSLGPRTELPREPAPAWTHLVVITASSFEEQADPAPAPELEQLALFEQRATSVQRTFSPSLVPAAAAASLWTGRWPASHGVLAPDLALAPGAWTLASAARAEGARTAAFLAEPFVEATRIGGFETAVERAAAEPAELLALAKAFLAGHSGERVLVWVHMARAGRAELGAALAELGAALAADGRAPDTATLVTAFAAGGARGEARWLVPLWIELPSGLFAGRRGRGEASLVDLALPLARHVLDVDLPNARRGERALQSRERIADALSGGTLRGPQWLHEGERLRWISGPLRVSSALDGGPPQSAVRAGSDAELEEPARAAALLEHARALAELGAPSSAEPSAVPPAWQAAPGWQAR